MYNDFLVNKNKYNKSIISFNTNDLEKYTIIPKKKVIQNNLHINKVILYDHKIITSLLEIKLNNRFNKLINYITDLYDSDSDNDEGYPLVLTEITKFRLELYLKYKMLTKEKLNTIDKKLFILENQLQLRMKTLNIQNINQIQESRRR